MSTIQRIADFLAETQHGNIYMQTVYSDVTFLVRLLKGANIKVPIYGHTSFFPYQEDFWTVHVQDAPHEFNLECAFSTERESSAIKIAEKLSHHLPSHKILLMQHGTNRYLYLCGILTKLGEAV